MSDELKPCPFCGGQAFLDDPVVWCVDCSASTCAKEDWNARAYVADTIAEAAWRKANLLGVELAEARKEIERLKAAVDEAKMARATVAGVPVEFEPRGWGMW